MSEKKKAEEGFLYNANYNAALLDERAWCKDQCHVCNQLRPSDMEAALSDLSQLIQADGKACIHRTTILV
ncbi:MAG: maltose acetyltransferase domain-containing protein [[Clostridium] innocuum]